MHPFKTDLALGSGPQAGSIFSPDSLLAGVYYQPECVCKVQDVCPLAAWCWLTRSCLRTQWHMTMRVVSFLTQAPLLFCGIVIERRQLLFAKLVLIPYLLILFFLTMQAFWWRLVKIWCNRAQRENRIYRKCKLYLLYLSVFQLNQYILHILNKHMMKSINLSL